MPRYSATIDWQRGDDAFTDNAYSRAHTWHFDGGLTVPATASPHHVRPPMSAPGNLDPEQALVAAASSCHMLWFLYYAALAGFRIDRYRDEADGVAAKNAAGSNWMPRITLRPDVTFSGREPSPADVDHLHHQAHQSCHIANSLRTDIVTDGRFSFA